MTTPLQIRTGLATALGVIDGFQISPYELTAPIANYIYVSPNETTYDLAGDRGLDAWEWIVQAFVPLTLAVANQVTLDELLASSGDMSIKAALEADTTLGGVVNDLRVVKSMGHQHFKYEGNEVLGSTWVVRVLANG